MAHAHTSAHTLLEFAALGPLFLLSSATYARIRFASAREPIPSYGLEALPRLLGPGQSFAKFISKFGLEKLPKFRETFAKFGLNRRNFLKRNLGASGAKLWPGPSDAPLAGGRATGARAAGETRTWRVWTSEGNGSKCTLSDGVHVVRVCGV